MKILYISGETVPGHGGGATHVKEVAENLDQLGHEVTCLVNRLEGQVKDETINNVRYLRTKVSLAAMTLPILHLKRTFGISFRMFDMFMERYAVMGGLGAILSKCLSKPLLLEMNGPHLQEALYLGQIKNKALAYLLEKLTIFQFNSARRIVAPKNTVVPSQYLPKFTRIDWGVNNKRFVTNLRESPRAKEMLTKYGLQDSVVFTFIGTFNPWHGVLDLVDAIDYFVNNLSDSAKKLSSKKVKFLLIGSGFEAKRVSEKIKEKGLEDYIVTTGKIEYDLMPTMLAISDVGVAPFNSEFYPPLKKFGFYWSPFKIFEYMASGLPVICPDIPELRVILGYPGGGILYKEGDIPGLANSIMTLLDEKKRKALALNNPQRIDDNYTWAEHAKKLDALMRKM